MFCLLGHNILFEKNNSYSFVEKLLNGLSIIDCEVHSEKLILFNKKSPKSRTISLMWVTQKKCNLTIFSQNYARFARLEATYFYIKFLQIRVHTLQSGSTSINHKQSRSIECIDVNLTNSSSISERVIFPSVPFFSM